MPRKKFFILVVTVTLLLTVLSPFLAVRAQPSRVPHENPARAEASTDLLAVLSFYGSVFHQVAARQYYQAHETLAELRYANVPEQLRTTFQQATTLTRELNTLLNDAERLLYDATKLNSLGEAAAARQKLEQAENATRNARGLLANVRKIAEAPRSGLIAFAPAVPGPLSEAYQQLAASFTQVNKLVDTLDQFRQQVAENQPLAASFYYDTLLEVSVSETAYPGLPVTVSGQIHSTGGVTDRTIKVLLDNRPVAVERARDQFSLQIALPPRIPTGRHAITVVVTPQEDYISARRSLPLNVTKIPVAVEVQAPSFNITPGSVTISGQVYHSLGPLPDAAVTLTLGSYAVAAKTAADGSFTAALSMPFDLFLFGPRELVLTVEPQEAWYAPLETSSWILTANLANLGVMLMAFVSLGWLALSRVRGRPSRAHQQALISLTPAEPIAITPTEPSYEPIRAEGRVLSAYQASLRAVEKFAGIKMAPHHTLREFTKTVTPLLPTAILPFTELTTMAEVALYSSHQVDERIEKRAEQLAGIIAEELHRGAT